MALMSELKEKYETQMNDFDTETHLANAIICSDIGLRTRQQNIYTNSIWFVSYLFAECFSVNLLFRIYFDRNYALRGMNA